MKKRMTLVLTLVVMVLFALPVRTWAHGEAEITVSPDTVAAGGKITVAGADLDENSDVKLSLEGLTYHVALGTVHMGDNQEFKTEYTIPAEAPEGQYEVKALMEDGDGVSADLTITAPKSAAPVTDTKSRKTTGATETKSSETTGTTMSKPGDTGMTDQTQPTQQTSPMAETEPMPSAAPHELPHPRPPFETDGLLAIAAVSMAIGFVLVLRK